jgi:hypothetical protein
MSRFSKGKPDAPGAAVPQTISDKRWDRLRDNLPFPAEPGGRAAGRAGGSGMTREGYTAVAVRVVTEAARTEHDFAGWLAGVLAAAAGQLGGSDELIIGRPGSWEASFVDQLVKGTVGYGDEYLPGPSGRAKLTDARVRLIRDRYWPGEVTQRQVAAEFGVSPSTVSDIVTGRTWRWLA